LVDSSYHAHEKKSSVKNNRLQHEKSPYLLQHADNPVDWYPWGEEAFEKARREDKPIFLSIGYSTCHWCHVMAHESFQDAELARLMNDVFVCIKVDREERPDIDNVYMNVCQLMTGSGGWPLNIVMTPEKRPFFAATYIPKDNRFGRPGMLDIVPRIDDIWKTRRQDVNQSVDQVIAALRQSTTHMPGEELNESTLEHAFQHLVKRFDTRHGGFGRSPKFPTPHNLFFLFRYWYRTGTEKALEMAEQTLQAMRLGGIYDHVGYGFHRYSTDSRWLLPHFEKMLYDQALVSMAYLDAFQATGKQAYADTAGEMFAYVLRDMASPSGGFYSAEDADSEGEEGKFYVWTREEILDVLGVSMAEPITNYYNIKERGNFHDEATGEKTGKNILHLEKSLTLLADELGKDRAEVMEQWREARKRLFHAREKRIHPHKDDKILTDWNGLMIAALARGAQILDEPRYAEAAGKAVRFILANMRTPDGRLLHRYRDGEAAITAHVDDYSFFIWGLIELYEATFNVEHLRMALQLNDFLLQDFWDDHAGGFYFTADGCEELLIRPKEIYDGAVPSGNSVAMWNLLRLGRMTANHDLEGYAARLGGAFAKNVAESPSTYTQLMVALDFALGPSFEVVIAGNSGANDTREMLKALRSGYRPNKVVLFRPMEEESPAIIALAGYTENQTGSEGKATAYICQDHRCERPTTDIEEMLQLLGKKE